MVDSLDLTPLTTMPPSPLKIGFLGHSGCGKDEAGLFLARLTPLRFVHSSSYYLAAHVAERTGIPVDVLRGPERHAHKEAMFRIGNELREDDPGIFVRTLLTENDIVAGLRDPAEVAYARNHGLVDLFFWLDRDVPVDSTMRHFGATPWRHADLTIDNRGTLAEFHFRLTRLALAHRLIGAIG